ncbi:MULTISPECIES: phage scaffolding protein [Bacillaceae]|uniref:phage scaffolding protein n=1 Tax=Bacillaceae TaxID=186817 RepID=UPI0023554031|nr:hypothetical protein [Bacillus weihaiensis]
MFAKPLFKPTFQPLLRLPIQFFSDSSSDPDDGDTDPDDEPSLAELIKNDPKLKQQYQELLKTQLGKRMKKFEGVDVEEYRQLKEKAEKNKNTSEGSEGDNQDDLKSELKAKEEKLLRAELREKRAVVKEFAVDQGVNPKLLTRLIDLDAIELDENGEADNLDELFEELQEEFPEYFKVTDEEEEKERANQRNYYSPGSHQKVNKKPKDKDKRKIGSSAYRRLKGIKDE